MKRKKLFVTLSCAFVVVCTLVLTFSNVNSLTPKAHAAPARPCPDNDCRVVPQPVSCPPTIANGDASSDVTNLQITLNSKENAGLTEDGIFGPLTQQAVLNWQKSAFPNDNTQWDGIVGPNTWHSLGYC